MKTNTVTVLLLATLVVACKPNYQSELSAVAPNTVKPVRVIELDIKDEPIPLTARGIISSKAQSTFSFNVGGLIESFLADER